MHASALRAALVVFIASFCILVIELVAGRILAPYVGVSLYTWTSIIGVVLAGISGGAWAGGWLADRRPRASTLGWLLIASGASALLIVPATELLGADEGLLTRFGLAMTLLQRVVALSFLLFFIPAFFLGMISPVAVKLAVRDLASTGRTVGAIYAFSTLGSIAGTFMTGFYFVARFGTRATLFGVGVALIATALLFGDLLGRRMRAAAAVLLAGGLLFLLLRSPMPAAPNDGGLPAREEWGIIHFEESQYYTIQVERTVREDTGAPIHALHLDHLVHSYNDLADPLYLEYEYLRTFNQVVDWKAGSSPLFRTLFIGGGGYTLPRLIDHAHPMAEVDVVEIDPAVTRVVHRFFGLPRNTQIRSVNEDARWFAMRSQQSWDLIFLDAFNDLSVPYHLTTREFAAELKRLLAPGGAIVVNIIDSFEKGRFLASNIATLQAVFGERNVALLMTSAADMESSRSTFVVVVSDSVQEILGDIASNPKSASWALPHTELQRYLRRRRAIVLTDDFAPVDNMLAPLFADRFVDEVTE
jgi:predicted membrane-bound spermidine synthase